LLLFHLTANLEFARKEWFFLLSLAILSHLADVTFSVKRGTYIYLGWMSFSSLLFLINSVAWNGNVANLALVHCDIATKILIGASVAVQLACYVLVDVCIMLLSPRAPVRTLLTSILNHFLLSLIVSVAPAMTMLAKPSVYGMSAAIRSERVMAMQFPSSSV